MYHMFDVDIAKQVGVIAATLFQNIAYWCQHSQANGTNYYDGNFWTYNTVKAFKTIFPYLSANQIDTGIKKLVEADLIIKGNYNKSAYDRTTWYAITKKGKSIFEKSEMENGKIQNGFGENQEPIPNINTDINASINKDISLSRSRAVNMIPEGFNDFWSVYPKKVAKKEAVKAFKSLNADSETTRIIIDDIQRRMDGEWRNKELQYIPHPATYLRGKRWEDETEETERAEYREPDPVIDEETERLIAEVYERNGRDAWM